MNFFEERVAARKARERQIRRRVNCIILGVLISMPVIFFGFHAIATGEDERPAPSQSVAPSPVAPTVSKDEIGERLAQDIVNIVAVEPAETGAGKVDAVREVVQNTTGCVVIGGVNGLYDEKADATAAIIALPRAEGWYGAMASTEIYDKARFVVVAIQVMCP